MDRREGYGRELLQGSPSEQPSNVETTRKTLGKAFIRTEVFVPREKDLFSSLGRVAERTD